MRQKPRTKQSHGENVVKDIRRITRKQYSAEGKIRIVLDGLKGEDSIRDVLDGQQPVGLTSDWCVRHTLPDDWQDQRALIATL